MHLLHFNVLGTVSYALVSDDWLYIDNLIIKNTGCEACEHNKHALFLAAAHGTVKFKPAINPEWEYKSIINVKVI